MSRAAALAQTSKLSPTPLYTSKSSDIWLTTIRSSA